MDNAIRGGAAALALAALACSGHAQAIMHTNEHPQIQMWSHPAGSANGAGAVRDRAPTFGGFSGADPDTGESVFYPGTGLDPSRRGSFIIASDTRGDVTPGLNPSRYQIDSLRVTTTLLGNLIYEPLGYVLEYDNTLDDAPSLTTGGGDDPGRPIEMYGIGLQGDYETIGFDSPDSDALNLGDVRWRPYREDEPGYDPEDPGALAPYQFFALDAQGRDAENSVAGGYSATEPDNATDPFTPTPFAIGKLYDDEGDELSPGALMESGDTFVFEPDLSHPGVLEYVQRSLSEGHLGFSFSSLHEPSGHTGTTPYPDFYLDDLDVGPNPDGAAPTIELQVTLLDQLVAGDYDGSGAVDQGDYQMWRSQYGSSGPGADGAADGVVNAADYVLWRDQLHARGPAQASPVAVPTPSGQQLVMMLVATVAFCGWQCWFVTPRRR